MSKNVAISVDTNVTKKETEMILKYKELTTETQRMWYTETKVIPVTTGEMKPPQYHSEISEQSNGKARNRATTDNSHTGHCTHTAEITAVKAQNIHNGNQ
jgi:hypothetical protein